MSCVLRVGGKEFDVDQFLTNSEITPIHVWRRGQARSPKSRPDGPKKDTSGANFEVSPADFSELAAQFEDARVFFRQHKEFVRRLLLFPGVERVSVDFGVEIHPPGYSSFTLPPDLLFLVGDLGVSLTLSVYPVADESESET